MTTQAKREYYEVLRVKRDATNAEIESSSQKLISEIRAAGGPNVIDRVLEVNRAKTVLMDHPQRKLYDQFGHAAIETASPSFEGFDDQGLGPQDETQKERIKEAMNWIELGLELFLD